MTSDLDGPTGGRLRIHVSRDREEAAKEAERGAVCLLRSLLAAQEGVRAMFAAAASQAAFLGLLCGEPGIAWSRVETFQLDEYVGLPAGHPAAFGEWLRRRLFDRARPKAVFSLDPGADHPEVECERYASRLVEAPIDVAFVGIGENGHLAFNDPGVADFSDPLAVRVVTLDEVSRMQQVHDGAFSRLDDVPTRAMTVTLPTIMRARRISLLAGGPRKAAAVAAMLEGPVSTACPASGLRRHPDVDVFLDADAAAALRRMPR